MQRDPAPPVGMPFALDFPDIFGAALDLNAAIHDGAVMIGRADPGHPYLVVGWSYRLHPPQVEATHPNKGSAFNSCVAMSAVGGIDKLILIGRDGTFRFRHGVAKPLDPAPGNG